jgi:FAD/FMN-containing dehydrogenase
MFQATIGGLGLTGLILWAEIKLKKIESPFLMAESIRYGSLDEFWELDAESNGKYDYTVTWIDCFNNGPHMGRGRYFRGSFATAEQAAGHKSHGKLKLQLPIDVPSFLWNPLTMRILSEGVYRSQLPRVVSGLEYYEPFFYPLDGILDWNRGYGKAGFLQYQFVVPGTDNYRDVKEILAEIRKADMGSFVNVFKRFGDMKSPGMLSFPRPGITLALDFAFKGDTTLKFLDKLDAIVCQYGGAVYPAKDARMSAESFQAFFPNWREFEKYIDPKFSSSFWRRVTGEHKS